MTSLDAKDEIPPWFRENINLAKQMFYKVGGITRFLAAPNSLNEIQETIYWAKKKSLPLIVIGAGTNSIFSDKDFAGVALSLENLRAWHWETKDTLYVEAGATNSEIANVALEADKSDAYWLFRLPGQIGATIRMNGRCYGSEMSNVVSEVLCINSEGEISLYKNSEFFQGYKSTLAIDATLIVIAAKFSLKKTSERNLILEAMQKCELDRLNKHHFDYPSCGSTFKNNYEIGIPCGKIFEDLNLKGTKTGGAMVSNHHANFVLNTGHASASDILTLAALMKKAAFDHKGYELNLEVEALGNFDSELLCACGLANNQFSGQSQIKGNLFSNSLVGQTTAFPKSCFSSFFIEYFRAPENGEGRVYTNIEQLLSIADARQNNKKPFVRWTTRCSEDLFSIFTLMPEQKPKTFVDNLWNYSVSELFIANPETELYDEFEITPNEHWIALSFTSPRIRGNKNTWDGTQTFSSKIQNSFGMTFTYEQIKHLINNDTVKIQCALSLGNSRYYLAPHWKHTEVDTLATWDNGNKPKIKADFHAPKKYFKLHFV